MRSSATCVVVILVCVAAVGEAAKQAHAHPPTTPASEAVNHDRPVQPWRDAGPPSPPELIDMVRPGTEWREKNGRCILRIDTCTAGNRIRALKGTIVYPDGWTTPCEGTIFGDRLVLDAPYLFAIDGPRGTAIAPMRVQDGKVTMNVQWHDDKKTPASEPIQLVSPRQPPPMRPRGNGT